MKERPRISQHERAKYKQWNIIHTYIKKNEQKQINKKKGKVSCLVLFLVYLVVRFFLKKQNVTDKKKFMSREIGIQE